MLPKLNVGITGSTGFVGTRFITMNQSRYDISVLDLRKYKAGDLKTEGLDAIVHFAGLAHQMKPVPDEWYYKTNVDLTKELLIKAKATGVKHFVYISSTKVFGDNPTGILNEHSACEPSDAYGDSKLKAEALASSFSSSDFQVAIVRPPVIYGPGVKGNILKLMELVNKNIPLPFGQINNARSMVFIDNLISLINTVIEKRAEGIFVAGDIQPVSTEQLARMIQKNIVGKEKLFAIPSPVKKLIRKLKPALYTRLFGSYIIDNSFTNGSLQFYPPYTTEEGITEMARWFKTHNQN